MKQEVVMSVDCLNYLNKSYQQFDFNSEGVLFIQNLQNDYLCLDENRRMDEAYENKIYELNDDVLFTLWPNIIEITEQIRFNIPTESHQTEFIEGSIAHMSKDGIWIIPDLSSDKKLVLENTYGNRISPISQKNYLVPSVQDLIIRDGLRFELKRNDIFPLLKYLRVCLRDATEVTIQDGYLVKDLPRRNLIQIINNIPKNAKLKIKTLSDLARCRHIKNGDDGYSVIKTERDINSRFDDRNIDFILIDDKRKLHQRKIIINNWIIDIGRGLDSIQNSIVLAETSFGIKKI